MSQLVCVCVCVCRVFARACVCPGEVFGLIWGILFMVCLSPASVKPLAGGLFIAADSQWAITHV